MTSGQPLNTPSIVWTRFMIAFARLFAFPMREEAAYRGEAFTSWGTNVLNQLGSDEGNVAIASALQSMLSHPEGQVAARLMLEELDAFTTYVERLTGVPIDPYATYPEAWFTKDRPARHPEEAQEGLGVGKIIVDSLTDLLDKLPFAWKAVLKAFSESIGIARMHR